MLGIHTCRMERGIKEDKRLALRQHQELTNLDNWFAFWGSLGWNVSFIHPFIPVHLVNCHSFSMIQFMYLPRNLWFPHRKNFLLGLVTPSITYTPSWSHLFPLQGISGSQLPLQCLAQSQCVKKDCRLTDWTCATSSTLFASVHVDNMQILSYGQWNEDLG